MVVCGFFVCEVYLRNNSVKLFSASANSCCWGHLKVALKTLNGGAAPSCCLLVTSCCLFPRLLFCVPLAVLWHFKYIITSKEAISILLCLWLLPWRWMCCHGNAAEDTLKRKGCESQKQQWSVVIYFVCVCASRSDWLLTDHWDHMTRLYFLCLCFLD